MIMVNGLKLPQLGTVGIGDDVEIGANTTIDRGSLDNTVISNGVKLDNQINIGHNVVIGGGVGIGGHLTIADGVQLTGMTMVTKSITETGVYTSGIPAGTYTTLAQKCCAISKNRLFG